MYQHQEFPKWKYHATEDARIVHNPEQEDALGDGWADTPAAFDSADPEEAEPAPIEEPAAEQPAPAEEPAECLSSSTTKKKKRKA